MNKAVQVDELYALEHLDGQHEHGFQREAAPAIFVEVFEGGSQLVHHHDVEVTFSSVVVDFRYANCTVENLVEFRFVVQLRELCLRWFELNGEFFIVLGIISYKKDQKNNGNKGHQRERK